MSHLTLKDLKKRVSLEVGRSRNATKYFTVLIPYIIGEGQVVAIVLTSPTTSIDMILALFNILNNMEYSLYRYPEICWIPKIQMVPINHFAYY